MNANTIIAEFRLVKTTRKNTIHSSSAAIIRTPWGYRKRTFVLKISRLERIIGKNVYWAKTSKYTMSGRWSINDQYQIIRIRRTKGASLLCRKNKPAFLDFSPGATTGCLYIPRCVRRPFLAHQNSTDIHTVHTHTHT